MSARAPRGRLIVVGDDALAPGLDERLHQAPVRADSVFDAIGRIRSAEAARPVVAVVVAEDRWPRGRQLSGAVHRVDPAVRVIRIAATGETECQQRAAEHRDSDSRRTKNRANPGH